MQRLRNLRIGVRLGLAFVFVLMLLVVIAGVGIGRLADVNRELLTVGKRAAEALLTGLISLRV